jgi:hypothetical protein
LMQSEGQGIVACRTPKSYPLSPVKNTVAWVCYFWTTGRLKSKVPTLPRMAESKSGPCSFRPCNWAVWTSLFWKIGSYFAVSSHSWRDTFACRNRRLKRSTKL